uniref:Interleukin n=1 Tax=Labrus bergylta TaxID=56723 RepID=A0A3Q3GJA0_9LABR
MKTMMLLVLPALYLLVYSLIIFLHILFETNLKHLIPFYVVQKLFVEDVSLLAEGKEPCGNKFFCKVHQILEKHEKIKKDIHFVHVLETYINETLNVNCMETLKNVTTSVENKSMSVLLENLLKCCQYRNLNAHCKDLIRLGSR